MKQLQSLLLALVAGFTISSCVVTDYAGAPRRGTYSSAGGVYDVLPNAYSGGAYYYQNRYYSGGRYERGTYQYQGRQYNDRYYHAGNYYYGGRHEQHPSRGHSGSRSYDSRGNGRSYNRR